MGLWLQAPGCKFIKWEEWNFPKAGHQLGSLEPQNTGSSKASLKSSKCSEIVVFFFPCLFISNNLTYSLKEEAVGQILPAEVSSVALLEVSESHSAHLMVSSVEKE